LKSMNVHIITGSIRSRRLLFKEYFHRFTLPAAHLILAGLLFIVTAIPLYAQKPIDYILLLDTSESMFRQGGNEVELIITSIMKDRLSYQDRFHLLSFAENPEFEIQKTLRDKESVQEVLARLMIIQPIEKNTDIVAALKFLTDYMSELPLSTDKQVLIISDDVHNPPGDSLFTSTADNTGRIETISSFLRRNGWAVEILLYPELESSEGPDARFVQRGLLKQLAELLGTEVVVFEGSVDGLSMLDAGEDVQEQSLSAGGAQESESKSAEKTEKPVMMSGNFIWLILAFIVVFILLFFLIRRVFSTAGSGSRIAGSGGEAQTTLMGVRSKDDEAAVPSFTRTGSDSTSVLSDAKRSRTRERETPYGTEVQRKKTETDTPAGKKQKDNSGVSVLSAFAARDRSEREGLALRSVSRSNEKKAGDWEDRRQSARFKEKEGQDAIEMRVDFQRNTFRKNTRWFDQGDSFSIGQEGVADFVIYSIDVSGVIATIRRKGETYTLNPEQKEYFPELKNALSPCLNRNIRIISPDTGFATTIRFHKWLSPLDRLNRMLHVIDKPGKPDADLD